MEHVLYAKLDTIWILVRASVAEKTVFHVKTNPNAIRAKMDIFTIIKQMHVNPAM